jgi:DNA-binding transcriptional MerR regulator
MDKEYYSSINEVSKRLSVPAYTLRYWEKQFPVAIRPTTGAGGRRYYRADTVERLTVIRDLLYKHGMTIAGVKKLLRSGNFPASASEFAPMQTTLDTENATETPAPTVPTDVPTPVDNAQIGIAIDLLSRARDLLKNG